MGRRNSETEGAKKIGTDILDASIPRASIKGRDMHATKQKRLELRRPKCLLYGSSPLLPLLPSTLREHDMETLQDFV